MDLFWDQKVIVSPTKGWRRNSFDKNYPKQEHHTIRKATVGLRRNSFDKNYPMHEHHTTCKTTVPLRRNSFDKNYPMQEHHRTRKTTVRLRHNSFNKNYPMHEHHMTCKTTVRLRRNSFDKNYPMHEHHATCQTTIRLGRNSVDKNYPMGEHHTTCKATKEDTHTWGWTKRLRNEADSTQHKRRSWEHERVTNSILRITLSRPTNLLQNYTSTFYPFFTNTTNDTIWKCLTAKQPKHPPPPPPPPLRVLPRRQPLTHQPPLMWPWTGVHASTIGATCTYETKREPTGSQSSLDETNRAHKQKRSTGVRQRASATNTTTWGSSSRNLKKKWRGWRKRWETSGTRTGATKDGVWWPRSRQGKPESRPDDGHTTTSN